MTKLSKSIIAIFACVFIIVSITMFIIMPKDTISFNENRVLHKAPKFTIENLFSGKLTEDIELYINDHFPFRDEIVGIKGSIEKLIGKKVQNGIYLGDNEYMMKEYHHYSTQMMTNHTMRINDLSSITDADIYFILAPTSNQIMGAEHKPKHADDFSQAEDINKFYNLLDEDINVIDIIPVMDSAKENYQVYFKLDHHWTSYGAYSAYTEFCSQKGITPYSINDFDIDKVTDDFNGTYYSRSTYYGYTPDTIDVFFPKFETEITYENMITGDVYDTLYFDDHLTTKDKYSYFLDSNQPLLKITNDTVTDDNSIAVIKDSYANIFVPFLANHYKTIYVIDMRYFNETLSEFIDTNEIEDILFLYNIETIQKDLGLLKIK